MHSAELYRIAGAFEAIVWNGSINDHVDFVCNNNHSEG